MAARLILSMNGVVVQEYVLSKERTTIGRKDHNDIVIDNLAVSGVHAAIVTLLNDSYLEDLNSTNGVSVNGKPTQKQLLQNNDLIEIGKYKLKYLNDQPGQATATDFEKTMVLRAPVQVSPASPLAKNAPIEATGKYKVVSSQATAKEKTVVPPPSNSGMPSESAAPAKASAPQGIKVMAPAPASPSPASPSGIASGPQKAGGMIQILTGPNAGKELELVKNLTTLGKPGVQVAVLTRRPHGYFITYVEGATYPMVNARLLDDQPQQLADHDIIELAGIKMEFYLKN